MEIRDYSAGRCPAVHFVSLRPAPSVRPAGAPRRCSPAGSCGAHTVTLFVCALGRRACCRTFVSWRKPCGQGACRCLHTGLARWRNGSPWRPSWRCRRHRRYVWIRRRLFLRHTLRPITAGNNRYCYTAMPAAAAFVRRRRLRLLCKCPRESRLSGIPLVTAPACTRSPTSFVATAGTRLVAWPRPLSVLIATLLPWFWFSPLLYSHAV
jgi:hypothetical protein